MAEGLLKIGLGVATIVVCFYLLAIAVTTWQYSVPIFLGLVIWSWLYDRFH
jgi:hypothetical protein